MNRKLSFLALIFISFNSFAQNLQFVESGNFSQENFVCNQENIHKKFLAETQFAKDSLISTGVLDIKYKKYQDDHILLEWPVAQNLNFDEPDYYGISNFVDHNNAFPDQIEDYNCGTVSYDLPNGYNHAGVDIFSTPFPWMKMDNDQVLVVAAAPGVVVYKTGDNFDENCDFNNTEGWNAVYVAHEDGSTAWYGHLKKNSLTNKAVGESVNVGEYLGVIGSSGSSTGPHLHFELYNAADELVDPYAGPCNPTTSTSWWRDQKPYKDPRILKLMTHVNPPVPYGCVNEEEYNAEINFLNGQTVLLATYLSDQTIGDILYHRLLRPDGSVFDEWEKEFENNYASSYWYYGLSVSSGLPRGKWTYQVVYEDQEVLSHNFYLKNTSDMPIISTPKNIVIGNETNYFTFKIFNTGKVGLNIRDFTSSDALTVAWEGNIAPDESKEVLVQLNNDIGDETEIIEISHNAKNNSSKIYVSKEPISIIGSNISNYDFGEVMVEVNDTLKLPIQNQGLGTLQIQDIISSDGFYVNELTFEIAPEQTDTIEVYFKPEEEQSYIGTMKILSNAVNRNELEVNLSGIGIPNLLLSNEGEMGQKIRVYPNPTKNELNINYELIDSPICSGSILDNNGKVLINSIFNQDFGNEYTLNISELSSGIYYLKLTSDNDKVFFKKFIKH